MKQYKPTTPGRRFATVDSMDEVAKKRPEKSLMLHKKRISGRDSSGRISVRHRGGGAKRAIRIIDARQERLNEVAQVVAIEYDPNRGARLGLVEYPDKELRYILAPEGLREGMMVTVSERAGDIQIGNRYPLKAIPIGSVVCNVELKPGQGGVLARAAGSSIQLMAVENGYAHLRLPSSEERLVPEACFATVGSMSNPGRQHRVLGKAGRSRHLGRRPEVRGKVMNPVDHPHGGGEGKQPIGLKYPKTKWGKHALGVKTRHHQKYSNRWIVHRRKK